ncbi:hypothetical protein [Peribacillus sp. NPDC097225]|uniref:hypothetical protein n=1 Tax=Peribacillus sp. NPDC097225 TaxID=3364400 RepID=UPI0037FA3725
MKKAFIGEIFILMSAILYSANVISVSISKLNFGGQSEVGYSLIVLSVVTGIIGIILFLIVEKDAKYGTNEIKEQKKSFLDNDLDN